MFTANVQEIIMDATGICLYMLFIAIKYISRLGRWVTHIFASAVGELLWDR